MIFDIVLADDDPLPDGYFFGPPISEPGCWAFYVVRSKTADHDAGWCRARIDARLVEHATPQELDVAMVKAALELDEYWRGVLDGQRRAGDAK